MGVEMVKISPLSHRYDFFTKNDQILPSKGLNRKK